MITMKKLLIMSGKGGVGKTTISVNLSHSLFKKNNSVGMLDVDIHGPNVLKLLGYENIKMNIEGEKLLPLVINPKFKVASIAGFIEDGSAIIWRGPRKHNAIKQLALDVEWGNLDYLIVDFPPGTGDEHISTAQILKNISGAIIISTPQSVSIMDMIRSVDFCKQMNIPIIGIIENMSGGIFGSNTVKEACLKNNLNFLGHIPLSEKVVISSENGKSFLEYDDLKLNDSFEKIVNKIIGGVKK